MPRTHLRRRWPARLLLAAAALPLFSSATCAERAVGLLLDSDFLDQAFDNRSNADKAEDILNDIDDLFDSVF